jgi:threonine aldolase
MNRVARLWAARLPGVSGECYFARFRRDQTFWRLYGTEIAPGPIRSWLKSSLLLIVRVQMIDLRSDTVTQPSPMMRRAMAEAEVGDDGFGEDPTVNALEQYAAELLGKEASIFVPSGTMANLLSALAHCTDRKRILLGDQSDMWRWEGGGASVFGGLIYHPLPTADHGQIPLEDIKEAITGKADTGAAPAGLICLEQSHCLCGGCVLPLHYLAEVYGVARANRIPLHIDAARLFNAAAALEVAASQIAQFSDSISFCLSKGLGAPVGSLLAGTLPFVVTVRRLRKTLGGGMRQAGVLAAAGMYALRCMRGRLSEDHANARLLFSGLSRIPGLVLDSNPPETNMVFWKFENGSIYPRQFLALLEQEGVRAMELGNRRIRAVTHYGVERGDIEVAVSAIGRAVVCCLRAHGALGAATPVGSSFV